MTGRIVPSREAEWTGLERCWAHIDQYAPRRGRLGFHLLAIAAGIALALVLIGIERSYL